MKTLFLIEFFVTKILIEAETKKEAIKIINKLKFTSCERGFKIAQEGFDFKVTKISYDFIINKDCKIGGTKDNVEIQQCEIKVFNS